MLLSVIESAAFENAVLVAILLNTASLAMDHHNMSDHRESGLEVANYIFSAVRGFVRVCPLTGLALTLALTPPALSRLVITSPRRASYSQTTPASVL